MKWRLHILVLLFVLRSPVAFGQLNMNGVRPDCSEAPVTVDDLLKLQESPSIQSAVHYLNALPEGSLQTFSFVHTTKSLQHHLVDRMWPRAIRGSTDGKILLSFVCNPKSQDYNKIEVLHYLDPPVAEWRSLSLDFSQPHVVDTPIAQLQAIISPHQRVTSDPVACTKCHGVIGANNNDLRPLIAGYPLWEGFYGSNDDVLHLGSKEHRDYVEFLKHAKADPCYQSLPWPDMSIEGLELYPYHEGYDLATTDPDKVTLFDETIKIKIANYHLRPNLKLTDSLSHLFAQRLAWKFLRKPQFRELAPLFAMEAIGCDAGMFDPELREALPLVDWKNTNTQNTFMDPLSRKSRASRLFSYGLENGIGSQDWQMNLADTPSRYFNTGAAGDDRRDISVGQMAQGVILAEITSDREDLQSYFHLSRGVSKFFAPQDFSCVDDIAGSIRIQSLKNRKKLCTGLKKAYLDKKPLYPQYDEPIPAPTVASALSTGEIANHFTQILRRELVDWNQRQRGEQLLTTVCASCHGKSSHLSASYQFLDSIDTFTDALRQPLFFWQSLHYLETGRMPKGMELETSDRLAIEAFILSTTDY